MPEERVSRCEHSGATVVNRKPPRLTGGIRSLFSKSERLLGQDGRQRRTPGPQEAFPVGSVEFWWAASNFNVQDRCPDCPGSDWQWRGIHGS
jgi:hypothetical protein